MTASPPRYSREETARRGQEIYDRDIRPNMDATHQGEYCAVDIETGVYVIDKDDFSATENLLARQPDAQIWLARVGHAATYRIGAANFAAMRKSA